ncbi:Non-reducing end beta-L-arabinofuranosidase [compost metagenome]
MSFTLALRIPGWCKQAVVAVNGERISQQELNIVQGYAKITRQWQQGDQVTLTLDMPVMRIHSHPHVRDNIGKVALQRGPFVYCLEQIDNGAHLHQIVLPQDTELNIRHDADLLGGITVIEGQGLRIDDSSWSGELYSAEALPKESATKVTFIPYYAWANRGENEMSVWVREK